MEPARNIRGTTSYPSVKRFSLVGSGAKCSSVCPPHLSVRPSVRLSTPACPSISLSIRQSVRPSQSPGQYVRFNFSARVFPSLPGHRNVYVGTKYIYLPYEYIYAVNDKPNKQKAHILQIRTYIAMQQNSIIIPFNEFKTNYYCSRCFVY